MILNTIFFLFISEFISESNFICGTKENFYLVEVSNGKIQDNIEKIEGIKSRKIKPGTWEIEFSGEEDKIKILYKNKEEKEVELEQVCFERIKISKIDYISQDIAEITFDIPQGEETEVISGLGKTEVIKNQKKLKIKYHRYSKFPYRDKLLVISKIREGYKEKNYFFFGDIALSSKLVIEGKTEPFSEVKIYVGTQEYKTFSDKSGNFSAEILIPPGLEKMKTEIKDRAGNITKEEIQIPKYKAPEAKEITHIIKVGNKLVIFTEGKKIEVKKKISTDEEKEKTHPDTISKDYKIINILPNLFVFIPNFGEYEISVGDRKFQIDKKEIPYEFEISPEKEKIKADGSEKVKIKIKAKDIFGNEIPLSQFNIEITSPTSEIIKEGKEFYILAEKMPEEVKEYKTELKAKIYFQNKNFFLEDEKNFLLIPGEPAEIDIKAEKDTIKGDGKEKAPIYVKLKDKKDNTVFIDEKIIDGLKVSVSEGKIELAQKEENFLKFLYYAESELDAVGEIKFHFNQIRQSVKIKISGNKVSREIGLAGGTGTNFGIIILNTNLSFFLRYALMKSIYGVIGTEGELAKYSGKIKIDSFSFSPFLGFQYRIKDTIYLRAGSFFALSLFRISLSSLTSSISIFSIEPEISFILTIRKNLFLNISPSYYFPIVESSQEREFLRIDPKDLKFFKLKSGIYYVF